MSDSNQPKPGLLIESTRFGQLEVDSDSVIVIPAGLIGFPRHTKFVMLEHKPPFYWLHSTEEAGLAFVVIDGAELLQNFDIKPPFGDSSIDLKDGDEFATLVVVTVRPDATQTTANLKAPVFVNLRNRYGIQIIFDDPRLTTRFCLFTPTDEDKKSKE